MPMLDERASESSVQPLHRFAFDQKNGSFAPCVPYGGSAAESGTIAPGGLREADCLQKRSEGYANISMATSDNWRSSRTCLFPVLCGFGLCFGYALLGACWLFRRFEGTIREQVRWTIPHLFYMAIAIFVAAFGTLATRSGPI